MLLTIEQRIKKAHIALMRHPETALYSGVMMMGTTQVSDDPITAYTDGVNKKYGRGFVSALNDTELNCLVLHENLHIVFRHLLHNRDLFEADRKLANIAADLVVNDVIMSLQDNTLCTLPKGGLHDPAFHNMNMRDIFFKLKKKCEGDKPNGQKSEKGDDKQGNGAQGNGAQGNGAQSSVPSGLENYSFDEHDTENEGAGAAENAEQAKELDEKIDRALREGALLAGRLKGQIPRVIGELLEPKARWQDELKEFVTASVRGKDEYTWKKFNRRLVANDIYLPSVENETIGEVVVAIDTSGSIGQAQLNEFATELQNICDSSCPEVVRVLWWDTIVHGEQVFKEDYTAIGQMLKPLGGGGTRASSVSDHIKRNNIRAECVIVFTDGYVEAKPVWEIDAPTLWLVTLNKEWTPPAGRKVSVEQ